MAYPFNRGTKAAPNWYGCYRDAAGKLRMKQAPREHAVDRRTVQKWIDGVQAEIDSGKPDPTAKLLCGPLMETWLASLDNRARRTDEWQARKYLLPRFADMPIKAITKGEVIRWLDELAKTKKTTRTRKGKTIAAAELLSGGSQKKLFTLLSRFLSWASARDHLEGNPCRLVPTGERPQDGGRTRRPWLADEEKVRGLVYALGPQYGLMFATARAGGLRLNEVCGLRIADTDALASEGLLIVRYSYDKPILKQDKGRGAERKRTLAPIHDATLVASLLALAKRRRDAGAKEDERLFDHLAHKEGAIRTAWSRVWRAAANAVGGVDGLGMYESSRHSMVSKALASGARYEEVSKAIGHASVNTTARYYDRHIERSFASLPTSDLGAPLPDGKVLPFLVRAVANE